MTPLGIQLRLHPREPLVPCDKNFSSDATFPCYYCVRDYTFRGRRYSAVIYEIYYKLNLGEGINGIMPMNPHLGFHDQDTERVAVLHDIATGAPEHVFFSAHAQEGRWRTFDQCKIANGRLVVYSALFSHRHCEKAMTNWRIFGLANDYTSDKGRHIDMSLVPDDIGYQLWEREVLASPFRAFFLPLYMGILPRLKAAELAREKKS